MEKIQRIKVQTVQILAFQKFQTMVNSTSQSISSNTLTDLDVTDQGTPAVQKVQIP